MFDTNNVNINQINLTLRFVLEMVMIVVVAIWGWSQGGGVLKPILAIGIPLVMVFIWGIFAVKNDPSRSGKTVVHTPGIIRLIMEISFFAFACWALFDMENRKLSLIIAIAVTIHYIFSFDRIKWLLKQK